MNRVCKHAVFIFLPKPDGDALKLILLVSVFYSWGNGYRQARGNAQGHTALSRCAKEPLNSTGERWYGGTPTALEQNR